MNLDKNIKDMKKTKTLRKTVVKIEILSEDYLDETQINLDNINYQITEGEWSGVISVESSKEISGKAAADAVIAQGSDPEFFQMDDEGNEIDE